MIDELARTVWNIKEIDIRGNTYLDTLINKSGCQLNTCLAVFFVETKAQQVRGFLVCVDYVDEILSPCNHAWNGRRISLR